MLESKIQSSIIKYAKLKGYLVVKTIKLSEAGFPDIFLFKNGITTFIEVKNEKGEQSELQKLRQSQIEKQGFEYHLIKSLDEFKKIIL